MPSNSSIFTLDKQIAKAQKELGGLDGRVDRAKATIANVEIIREELEERISYLSKIRARKLAAGEPVAAVDGATPVLNTELEEVPVELPETAIDADPRLTSAV